MSGPRPQNAQNRPPGITFDTFVAQGLKMLKISLLESRFGTCLAQGLKMFKMGLLGTLLTHFWPKA